MGGVVMFKPSPGKQLLLHLEKTVFVLNLKRTLLSLHNAAQDASP